MAQKSHKTPQQRRMKFHLSLPEDIQYIVSFCLKVISDRLLSHGAGGKLLHTARVYRNQNSKLEMWANAQRDSRPAEYRWRPLFNAVQRRKVWLTPTAVQ